MSAVERDNQKVLRNSVTKTDLINKTYLEKEQ